MSGTIAQASVGAPLYAPTEALRAARIRTSLFQGCAYAVDPRPGGAGYVFQLQAVRTGPGDVEDLRVHRFRLDPSTGDPSDLAGRLAASIIPSRRVLTYVDTMTVERGGHVQSCHVRISSAGNPYVWAGLEEYDGDGKTTGRSLYRIKYRPDVHAPMGPEVVQVVKTSRKSSNVQRVWTGPGTVDAVGCPGWTIVLRRPGGDTDTYEWHSEKELLGHQVRFKGATRPTPTLGIRFPHGRDDSYQSSLAQGRFDTVGKRRVYRLTGADRVLIVNSDTIALQADLTQRFESQLVVPSVEHVEPEGMFTLGGLLHIGVQTGSVAQRRVAYLPLSW